VFQKFLRRRTVYWINTQTFVHEVRYPFHVRRAQFTASMENALLEWFARKMLKFLEATVPLEMINTARATLKEVLRKELATKNDHLKQ